MMVAAMRKKYWMALILSIPTAFCQCAWLISNSIIPILGPAAPDSCHWWPPMLWGASWSTNAAQIDSANAAILKYRDVETNGNANINLRTGTVRFWFRPDWSSAGAGGAGPGSCGRLIEAGSNSPTLIANSWVVGQTNGWWALFFATNGNQLLFGSSTNGFGGVNLAANIAWVSNQWHQVVLAYSPTNSSLYLDGQLATNGAGSIYYPNIAERSAGLRIGSDQNGTNQAGAHLMNWKTSIMCWRRRILPPIIRPRRLGMVWELGCPTFGGWIISAL